jgi:hypothetical protein
MKKQQVTAIYTAEDVLAAAEALAAPYGQSGGLWRRLPPWAKNVLWAAAGAGGASLLWMLG